MYIYIYIYIYKHTVTYCLNFIENITKMEKFLVRTNKPTDAPPFAKKQLDIFDRLNGLNLSLQGRETHILLLADKVHAFTQKLDLWHGRISRGNCDMFPSLADFITDAGTSHDFSSLFQSASEHLSAMRKQFATYFKEESIDQLICRNSLLS